MEKSIFFILFALLVCVQAQAQTAQETTQEKVKATLYAKLLKISLETA